MTAERYASYPHVVISRHNKIWGPVDDALERLGLRRRVIMALPAFANAIPVVQDSDILGLVPLSCSACFASGARQNDLAYFDLPVETPAINISLIWHPRMQTDPLHRWLRETIMTVCRREQAARG